MSKRFGNGMIGIGACLILLAGCLTCYNIYDNNRAYDFAVRGIHAVRTSIAKQVALVADSDLPVVPDYQLDPDMEMPALELDGSRYIGLISLPEQDMELPVLSECSDAGLRQAPCRYSGSIYDDDCIIAGHNYRSHFGRLGLSQIGDRVVFTDIDGNEFIYEVVKVETVAGTDVEGAKSGDWDLTLFTCTLGGQNRILVRCERLIEGGLSL